MFLIRSIVLANPGRRDEAVRVFKEFSAEVLSKAGGSNIRVLTGSIGPSDSTVITESEHKSLADFETSLTKANSSDQMARYGQKFAELTVPGSHRFEVYRIS
jgi:hypothetical protein